MEHWGTVENLRQGFLDFVSNIPFYGLAVCCTDHPEVQALVGRVTDRRIVTFGFNAQADVRATGLRYQKGIAQFDVVLQPGGEVIQGCTLPMPGDHNVSNALAAVAVARHLGVPAEVIREALAKFGGVNRRFTKVGEVNGVTIIDDYGHHPVEIAAVLRAARQSVEPGCRVIAVHQPHRYTRLSTPVRGVLRLLQRGRRRRHRRGLCRRRGADPGRQPRRSGVGPDPARPPPCPGRHLRGRPGAAGARAGAAGRRRRLPRRRHDLGLGERAASATGGAGAGPVKSRQIAGSRDRLWVAGRSGLCCDFGAGTEGGGHGTADFGDCDESVVAGPGAMSAALIAACLWFVIAHLVALIPSRDSHWSWAYALIAAGIPLVGWVTWADGPILGLIVLAAGVSVLRWPVYHLGRWARRRLTAEG